MPKFVHFRSSALTGPWASALGLRYGSELAIRMGHNRLEAGGASLLPAACALAGKKRLGTPNVPNDRTPWLGRHWRDSVPAAANVRRK